MDGMIKFSCKINGYIKRTFKFINECIKRIVTNLVGVTGLDLCECITGRPMYWLTAREFYGPGSGVYEQACRSDAISKILIKISHCFIQFIFFPSDTKSFQYKTLSWTYLFN